METIKCDSGKNNFLLKTWKRCQSLPIGSSSGGVWGLAKIKSLNGRENTTEKVTPKGCISVCVGPEKQRFAVKIKYASHPLFSMLLEADAQTEDGYNFDGEDQNSAIDQILQSTTFPSSSIDAKFFQ